MCNNILFKRVCGFPIVRRRNILYPEKSLRNRRRRQNNNAFYALYYIIYTRVV